MKLLLDRVLQRQIDPLEQAPRECAMFRNKEDNYEKLWLKLHYLGRTHVLVDALPVPCAKRFYSSNLY